MDVGLEVVRSAMSSPVETGGRLQASMASGMSFMIALLCFGSLLSTVTWYMIDDERYVCLGLTSHCFTSFSNIPDFVCVGGGGGF